MKRERLSAVRRVNGALSHRFLLILDHTYVKIGRSPKKPPDKREKYAANREFYLIATLYIGKINAISCNKQVYSTKYRKNKSKVLIFILYGNSENNEKPYLSPCWWIKPTYSA